MIHRNLCSIPVTLLNLDLDFKCFKVLAVLIEASQKEGFSVLTNEELMAKTGVSHGSVDAALKKLSAMEFITRKSSFLTEEKKTRVIRINYNHPALKGCIGRSYSVMGMLYQYSIIRGFIKVPLDLFTDKALTYGEFKSMAYLISKDYQKGDLKITNRELSEELNLSIKTISNAINNLSKKGYLIKETHFDDTQELRFRTLRINYQHTSILSSLKEGNLAYHWIDGTTEGNQYCIN